MDIYNDILNEQLNKFKNLLTLSGIYNLLNLDNNLIDFKSFLNVKFEDDEEYMNYLYAHKWHPFTGYHLTYQMVKDIMKIKRQVADYKLADKLINKTIFFYYSPTEIKKLKDKWGTYVNDFRKRILKQSLSAYLRGEHALTIYSLVPLWNIFINNISNANKHNIDGIKKEHNAIISQKKLDAIYDKFFNDYFYYDCRSIGDVISDVPGRHAVAHGYITKYPSKKSALNAIIFTDFLINLEFTKFI